MSEDTSSIVLLLKKALAPERVWAGIKGICSAVDVIETGLVVAPG